MEKMLQLRDWSNLPADATRDIASWLSDDADYVRFRSVCTSWRSATTKRPLLPWLIFRKSASLQLCSFYNTDEIFPAKLPEEIIVCGSSFGWVFVLDDTLAFYICNLFSGRQIPLPRLPEMPYRVVRSGRSVFLMELDFDPMHRRPIRRKHFHSFEFHGDHFAKMPYQRYAVMSSDPATAPDDCIVVTQSHRTKTLIHCRPGDTCWTPLPGPLEKIWGWEHVFYKGQFYALLDFGFRLFACPTEPGARATEILPANPLFSDGQTRETYFYNYLEVFYEDLLVVSTDRCPNELNVFIETYEVFRVDLDGGQLRFVKLENLGGRALFVGYGGYMPVYVGNSTRFKGNCVYHIFQGSLKVFNMEDGSIEYLDEPSGAGWVNFITLS